MRGLCEIGVAEVSAAAAEPVVAVLDLGGRRCYLAAVAVTLLLTADVRPAACGKHEDSHRSSPRITSTSQCAGMFLTLLYWLYLPTWTLFPQSKAAGTMAAANRVILSHHSSKFIGWPALRLRLLQPVTEGTFSVLQLETCRGRRCLTQLLKQSYMSVSTMTSQLQTHL